MISKKVSLEETKQFSPILLDYLDQKESLHPFYHRFPKLESFKAQIEEKELSKEIRNDLADVLTKQYEGVANLPSQQITLLKEQNTFTVTTGHQLNIFSGPLYFIYKIVSAINLAEALKKQYPEKNFVPIYWMASEDHDFEEISHFTLFGKKHQWEREWNGAVGRMNLEGIEALWEEILEMPEFFKKAYTENKTLADATRAYVHHLFGDKGLVVLDADAAQLKKHFTSIIEKDILENKANDLVEAQSKKLDELGYKTQVFPRKINFFYLQDQTRDRIEQEDDKYQVLNTSLKFAEEDIKSEIDLHPERFSPNVVMRPLYQEVILPNLAYIGGPAEVAYWFQLKPVFDYHKILFPIVMPRNFAQVINKGNYKKMKKLNVDVEVFFKDEHTLRAWFVDKNADTSFELTTEIETLEKLFEAIEKRADEIDSSLVGFVGAEAKKGVKNLQNIEKRLRKAEERKQDTAVKQLLNVRNSLFPNGSPQERVENLLTFHLNDKTFIDTLFKIFNPLEFDMNILIYDD